MRRSFLSIFFLLVALAAKSSELSPTAEISLVTLAPGEELYSVFGHSAIRLKDTANAIDLAFNYGTFNFHTPNFYMKFARGKLDYMLSAYDFKYVMPDAINEDRMLIEQRLDLTPSQVKEVYKYLLWNYREENKYYKYEFFYDNCATKIRDIIEKEFKGQLEFGDDFYDHEKSFRDMIDIYLVAAPWADLGIDILLGLPTDKKIDSRSVMFLPDYLSLAFGSATVPTDSGSFDLVKSNEVLHNGRKSIAPPQNYMTSPYVLLWVVFVISLIVSIWELKNGNRIKVWDFTVFFLTGLIGWLIVFLWFFTDHLETKNNLNIIWAMPLNLFFSFAVLKPYIGKTAKLYFRIIAILLVGFLILWPFLPQDIHVALVPIVLSLTVRSSLLLEFKFWKLERALT